MAARKTTKTQKKPHYVRTKKRKGTETVVVAQRSVVVILSLLILAAVLVAIGLGFKWIGRQLFSENPRFEIQHLVISCDGTLKEDQIREYTGLHEGMNLFALSFSDISSELAKVPVVESVDLERKLPDTLMISVKERVPVARILINNYRMPRLLDRYGYILPPRADPALVNLPLVKGFDGDLQMGSQINNRDMECVLKIIALCESKKYLHTYISIESMDVKYSDFIDMRLSDGIRVKMPYYSLESKLSKLAATIEVSRTQGKRIKDVDLMLESEKVPVTTY